MSAKSRRSSRGSCKNPKVANKATELSRSGMTPGESERQLLDALSQLPQTEPKPIYLGNIKRAARRGAREARAFLAENPTQDHMQASREMHKCEMHNLDDSPVQFAYYSAYLETLERRGTRSPPARQKNKGARPTLTVMDDYGTGALLWLNWIGADNIGAGDRCCSAGYRYEDEGYRCGLHPMSNELFEALKEWTATVADAPRTEGTLIDPDDPMSSGYLVKPAVMLNWSDFHARGLKLTRRLKQEVGAAFRVIYEKSWADPARQDGQRFEVLDDGSVVSLPPRRPSRFICSE
jgi:hypothetical protein